MKTSNDSCGRGALHELESDQLLFKVAKEPVLPRVRNDWNKIPSPIHPRWGEVTLYTPRTEKVPSSHINPGYSSFFMLYHGAPSFSVLPREQGVKRLVAVDLQFHDKCTVATVPSIQLAMAQMSHPFYRVQQRSTDIATQSAFSSSCLSSSGGLPAELVRIQRRCVLYFLHHRRIH